MGQKIWLVIVENPKKKLKINPGKELANKSLDDFLDDWDKDDSDKDHSDKGNSDKGNSDVET